jgi:adenylate cyclase
MSDSEHIPVICLIAAGGLVISTNTLESRQTARLASMLAIAEKDGAKILFIVRTLAILAIYGFFLITNTWSARLFYQESFCLVFLGVGFAAYYFSVAKPEHHWLVYVLGLVDLVVLLYIILSDNPFDPTPPFPTALHVREGSFQYLLIFVSLSALTLSPRLVMFMGLSAALLWGLVILWVFKQPATISDISAPQGTMTRAEEIAYFLSPNFLSIRDQGEHIVVMCVVAGILATVVWRSCRFVRSYVSAERARSNLARHFSPKMIDEIANQDQPLGPVRKQNIGVLFADIVGFTKFSEEHPPERVFHLLREFHQRMEQIIFQHQGTLDNYMGDCVMATFGVPSATPEDARNAMACGLAMITELERWNTERSKEKLTCVDARVGVHFGPVVLGAIGSERILSFAVIGDTCNVASRLQALCRDIDADLCVGHACLEAMNSELNKVTDDFGLDDAGFHELRGRSGHIRVWKKTRLHDKLGA